jgi:murein DD-endopeptidase MepM/ murein hydrolase activator NlpD
MIARFFLVVFLCAMSMAARSAPSSIPYPSGIEPVLEVASFGMIRANRMALRVRDTLIDASTDPAAVAGGDFYLTADTIGLPDTMVDDIVNILSSEVDFHRDLAHGFKCTVLYEMQFEDGQISKSGKVLAVKLETPARTWSAYLFDRVPAASGYYAADGKPMRNTFLQSPILFSRITSVYSVRRFHPILKMWRAHNGIDFAAPLGTPVRATADGVLGFAGVRGAYGNLLTVSHANGISTFYGHLQSMRPGLKVGQRIRQGEIIAAVGMTGLATGPHLHYELRQHDRPLNPSSLTGTPQRLSVAQRTRFNELKLGYDHKLAVVYRTHFVQR